MDSTELKPGVIKAEDIKVEDTSERRRFRTALSEGENAFSGEFRSDGLLA